MLYWFLCHDVDVSALARVDRPRSFASRILEDWSVGFMTAVSAGSIEQIWKTRQITSIDETISGILP